MKNLRQKLLISLVLVMCLFLWRSYASQTINVINWNPWGILKLNQIILKTWTNATWIILNGNSSNAYIQIARWNSSAASGIVLSWNTSTILVNRICDANWNNCRNVANILTWNWWGWWGWYWQVNEWVISTSWWNYKLALRSWLSVTWWTTNINNKLFVYWWPYTPVQIDAIGFIVTGNTVTILNNDATVKGKLKVQSEDNSVIWVDSICDQNGNNCNDVSDLGTWWGGWWGWWYWRKPSGSSTLYASWWDYSIAVHNISASGTTKLNGNLIVTGTTKIRWNLDFARCDDTTTPCNSFGRTITTSKNWLYINVPTIITGTTTIAGILKVKTGTDSKIYVNQVCDANWSNCKPVANLNTWAWGWDNLFKYVSSTAKIYTSWDRHFIVTGGQIRTKELFVTTNGLKVTWSTVLYNNLTVKGTTTLDGSSTTLNDSWLNLNETDIKLDDSDITWTWNIRIKGSLTVTWTTTISWTTTMKNQLKITTWWLIVTWNTTIKNILYVGNDNANCNYSGSANCYASNTGLHEISQVRFVPKTFAGWTQLSDVKACDKSVEWTLVYRRDRNADWSAYDQEPRLSICMCALRTVDGVLRPNRCEWIDIAFKNYTG